MKNWFILIATHKPLSNIAAFRLLHAMVLGNQLFLGSIIQFIACHLFKINSKYIIIVL